MSAYFSPPTILYEQRQKFYRAKREKDENVQQWGLRLKVLASKCKFGSRLNTQLADQFITGMDGGTFTKLCDEDEITFEKATEIAQKHELRKKKNYEHEPEICYVRKHVLPYKNQQGRYNTSVKAAKQMNSTPLNNNTRRKCKHCGYSNHSDVECRYKNFICNRCNIKGYMASVCSQPGSRINAITNESEYQEGDNSYYAEEIFYINDENEITNKDAKLRIRDDKDRGTSHGTSSTSADNEEVIYNIFSTKSRPVELVLRIFNIEVKFQVDSGAGISAIPLVIFKKYFDNYKLQNDKTVVRGYGGNELKVVGSFNPVIRHKGITQAFKFLIIDNVKVPILGLDFFRAFNINEIYINNVEVKHEQTLKNIVSSYNDLFRSGIRLLKNVTVKLEMGENVVPKFCKARQIAHAFREDVEDQLQSLVQQQIISKCESAQWGTPLVPVLKKKWWN